MDVECLSHVGHDGAPWPPRKIRESEASRERPAPALPNVKDCAQNVFAALQLDTYLVRHTYLVYMAVRCDSHEAQMPTPMIFTRLRHVPASTRGVLGRAFRPAATGCRRRASASVRATRCFSVVAPSWSHSIFCSCAGSTLDAETRGACYQWHAHRGARSVVGTKTLFPIPPWGVRYGS